MQIIAVESTTAFIFSVTEGADTWTYEWGKTPPDGQTVDEYLQSCKREALLLAGNAIAAKQPPTTLDI